MRLPTSYGYCGYFQASGGRKSPERHNFTIENLADGRMQNKKKQAQFLVPVGSYFAGAGCTAGFSFLIRQVESDMHRLVQIRIRLLVIFWQIVQFLEQRLTFTFEAIVDTRQTGCIVFVVLFLTLA
jgi:hypothetical protein